MGEDRDEAESSGKVKELILVRFQEIKDATLGLLLPVDKGLPYCYTLENRWLDNQRNTSSIPTGEYTCQRTERRFTGGGTFLPVTYEVLDVPGRSGILFHPGNTADDTEGCILTGTSCVSFRDRPGVRDSRAAFRRLLVRLGDAEEFKLLVVSLHDLITPSGGAN